MARKRNVGEAKLRTREHIVADLAVNYVERQILLRGFAVYRLYADYGIDLGVLTFADTGEVEAGHILIQVKGTDNPKVVKGGDKLSIRVDVADLKSWQDVWAPLIFVVYDGRRDRAYWLYIQEYLDEKNVTLDDVGAQQDRVTLRIPLKNRLNRKAVERFQQFRNDRKQQLETGKLYE